MDPFEEEANKWQSRLRALKQEDLKKKLNAAALEKARITSAITHKEDDLLTGKIVKTSDLLKDLGQAKLINKQAMLRAQYPDNSQCSSCGCVMLERTNKTTGQKFGGCSHYPQCNETLQIPGQRRNRY